MADPLSISASVIALVQLTGKLIALGYEYIGGVKNASKDLRELVDELQSLGKVLIVLQEYTNTDKNLRSTALQSLNGQNGPLPGCSLELKRLQLSLEPKQGLLRGVIKSLKWPFKEHETLQHITRIQRQKSLFILALTTDNIILSKAIDAFVRNTNLIVQNLQTESAALAKELEAYTQSTGRSFQRLEERIQDLHAGSAAQDSWMKMQDNLHTDEKRKKILNWLYSENFDTKHLEISNRRQKNTGGWILETPGFCNWLKENDPNSRLLWGYGIPGAGKTFLSSVTIDHLLTQKLTENYGVAYVYFDYKEQDRQMPGHVLSSLLKQLASQLEVIPAEVEGLYNRLERYGKRPTSEELSTALLMISKNFDRVFLVFDALDECDQKKQRRGLLPLFHTLAKNGVNLFITSRQYPEDIQSSLCNSEKIELLAKKEDIETYIRQKIDENDRAKRLVRQGNCKDRIISNLVDCAQGMFLLVHFHLECLCQQTTVRQILTELDRLKNTSTLAGERPLDPTYDRAMEKLCGQPKNCTELALTILSWLVKARRTLTVDELRAAVSIVPNRYELDEWDLPDKTTLLDVCASLVVIDEESNTIRLAHYTVQEYLLKNSIITENIQVKLAVACITFLSFSAFSIPSGGLSGLRARFESYPLLKYIAYYLPLHLKGYDEDSLTKAILKFIESPGNLSSYFDAFYAQRPARELYRFDHLGDQPIFHAACALGYCPVVSLLLKRGADLSTRNTNGRTALLEAASGGCEKVLGLLIESGADISVLDMSGKAALHLAASGGHDGVVRLLLEKGVGPSVPDINGLTALHHSALRGHEKVMQLLIEKDANPLALDKDGKTALHRAAFEGNEGIVRLLLEKGFPVGTAVTDDTGSTPLHLSASAGHEAITKLLLEEGSGVFLADNKGRTILHRAVSMGCEDIIRLILKKGLNISERDKNGRTALHLAASIGLDNIAKFLLDEGADVSTPDNNGSTPLHFSASGPHLDMTSLLLHRGADPSAIDNRRQTPLRIAANKQAIGIIQLLLNCGADPFLVSHNGWTLLHLAAMPSMPSMPSIPSIPSIPYPISKKKSHLIKWLLDNKVDISTPDKDGYTALHHAVSTYSCFEEEILRLLLDNGADISSRSTSGQTALHVAASRLNKTAISILIEKGADASSLDHNEQTSLHLAAQATFTPFFPEWKSRSIKLLLEKEKNTLVLDKDGSTAIHYIASSWNYEAFKILLDNGSDVCIPNKSGQSALYIAATKGCREMIRFLDTVLLERANVEYAEHELVVRELDAVLLERLRDAPVMRSMRLIDECIGFGTRKKRPMPNEAPGTLDDRSVLSKRPRGAQDRYSPDEI